MADVTRTFSVDYGLSPGGESSPGIFAGSIDPNSDSSYDSAVLGSVFYRDDTAIQVWHKHDAGANGWHLIFDYDIGLGRNSISLFIGDKNGEAIGTGSFSVFSFKPIGGIDQYLPSVTFVWGVVAESSSGGKAWVRLVDELTQDVIGELLWDNETVPTFKSLNITADMKTGVRNYEVQLKKESGNGVIYSSGLEVKW